MNVQNQLLALIFILLALVSSFMVLGWELPILVGAAAALLVRIQDLTPEGKPGTIDGGPRWMALLLTPLVGSTAAVVGLLAAGALIELDIFGEAFEVLIPLPLLMISGPLPTFTWAALGMATALGWSAKLPDAMLGKVTKLVETKSSTSTASDSDTEAPPTS